MTDREKLIDLLQNFSRNCEREIGCINCEYNKESACKIHREVDYLLASDVVEVEHGKWLPRHYEGGFMDGTNFEECSVCRYYRFFDDVRFRLAYEYCPKCGAKMDLE